MFALRSIGNTKQDGWHDWLPFKMQNDTKQKQANKRKKRKCVRTQYVDLCQKQRKR